MTYRLAISDAAKADLAAIVAWYDSKDTAVALRFEFEAHAAFDLLQHHPLAFPVILKPVRKLNLEHFPYSIFYEIGGSKILVLAITHHSRYPRFGHH